MFHEKCGEYGIMHDNEEIFRYMYEFQDKSEAVQLTLWDL